MLTPYIHIPQTQVPEIWTHALVQRKPHEQRCTFFWCQLSPTVRRSQAPTSDNITWGGQVGAGRGSGGGYTERERDPTQPLYLLSFMPPSTVAPQSLPTPRAWTARHPRDSADNGTHVWRGGDTGRGGNTARARACWRPRSRTHTHQVGLMPPLARGWDWVKKKV